MHEIRLEHVNRSKFIQELSDNNVKFLLATPIEEGNPIGAKIDFGDTLDEKKIEAVVNKHDPTIVEVFTQEDYLTDLDFRLSMVELGLV